MVSDMENIDRPPNAQEAREALVDIQTVQRAVRNTPWPSWLYLVNAALLGALVLTLLLEEQQAVVFTAVAVVVVAVNVVAGYRSGAPWVLPTSLAFFVAVAVAVAGLCVFGAFAVAGLPGMSWLVVVLAACAMASYVLGAVAHRRSSGQRR